MIDVPSTKLMRFPRRRRAKALLQVLLYLVAAFCIIVPIRFFIVQPFVVSGASMEPTFMPGQYLVIDEITYHSQKPMRGDVIIFRYPLDPSVYLIKRIIGLPGETVRVSKGIVSISEGTSTPEILTEPYRIDGKHLRDTSSTTLGTDEYFVMGDNRDASSDSRVWGPLQQRFIMGRALFRAFPFNVMNMFPGKYEFSL